jgi:site-specific recombinase XerD
MDHPFFRDPRTIRRLYDGPLGEHLDALAARLQERGYSYQSARVQLRAVAELSRWLARQGRRAKDLRPHHVEAYLRYRKQQGLPFYRGAAAACQTLLRLLADQRIILPERRPRPRRGQRVEEAFAGYLTQERGLAAATVVNYTYFVRQFLRDRFGGGRIQLAALRPTDITRFVQRHAHDGSPKSTQAMLSALRAFLRHLWSRGTTAADLATCVPGVPPWRFATLPKYLRPGQVRQVLQACDRRSAPGRRDYAILLLLARLGLRAGEVIGLRLEDIDWGAGVLTVRSKGGRWTQLPLPADVGVALVRYLQRGRPRCASRQVFIRQLAPLRGFADSTAISTLVARALRRAGVAAPHTGAHVFRHSLATGMLRAGASLAEIGELLRHRHPDTTRLYAKVDVRALRALALPWPGGGR